MSKYYVSGCKDNGIETVTCDDSEAQFWTLYVRDDAGLSQGVIDCVFREDAEAAMAVYVERDALQEQVRALGVESVELKSAFNPEEISEEAVEAFTETAIMDHDWDETGSWSWIDNDTDVIRAVLAAIKPESPATDAALREIQAQGINRWIESRGGRWNGTTKEAEEYATRLRSGEQP